MTVASRSEGFGPVRQALSALAGGPQHPNPPSSQHSPQGSPMAPNKQSFQGRGPMPPRTGGSLLPSAYLTGSVDSHPTRPKSGKASAALQTLGQAGHAHCQAPHCHCDGWELQSPAMKAEASAAAQTLSYQCCWGGGQCSRRTAPAHGNAPPSHVHAQTSRHREAAPVVLSISVRKPQR